MWIGANMAGKPEDYIEVRGAVPVGAYKSGPSKGLPKWAPGEKGEVVWMRQREVDETKRLWEVETGKCAACQGVGEVPAGWSAETGPKARLCKKCSGSGVAPAVAVGSKDSLRN